MVQAATARNPCRCAPRRTSTSDPRRANFFLLFLLACPVDGFFGFFWRGKMIVLPQTSLVKPALVNFWRVSFVVGLMASSSTLTLSMAWRLLFALSGFWP